MAHNDTHYFTKRLKPLIENKDWQGVKKFLDRMHANEWYNLFDSKFFYRHDLVGKALLDFFIKEQWFKITPENQDKVYRYERAFLNACYEQPSDVVLKLLKAGANPNAVVREGNGKLAHCHSALMLICAWHNDPQLPLEFLKFGADWTHHSKGDDALSICCSTNPDYFKILQGAGVGFNFPKEKYFYSMLYNSPELLKDYWDEICAHYLEVPLNDTQETPLLVACPHQPEVVFKLLQKGANVNAKNKSGQTALFKAMGYGQNKKLVKTLLHYGADINTTTKDGITVLMEACRIAPLFINMLFDNGAKLTLDKKGRDIFHYTQHNPESEAMIRVYLEKKEMDEFLQRKELSKRNIQKKTRTL